MSCRFGLLIDPLGMTGSLCGSHCEPTGLSQYPVFKVQTAADSLHILRFYPPRAVRFVFGGKEIHYALTFAVSTGFSEVFRLPFTLPAMPARESKNASRMHLGGESNGARRTAARSVIYRFVSPRHSVFNTRSSLPEQPAVRWSNVPAPNRACKGFREGSSICTPNPNRRARNRARPGSEGRPRRTTPLMRWAGRSGAFQPAAPGSPRGLARTYICEVQVRPRRS